MRAPRGLNTAGRKLWSSLTVDDALEWDVAELVTLERACRVADLLADLDAQIAELKGNFLMPGSRGSMVIDPRIAERRHNESLLQSLLARLVVHDEDGAVTTQQKSAAARAAAHARWRRPSGLGAA